MRGEEFMALIGANHVLPQPFQVFFFDWASCHVECSHQIRKMYTKAKDKKWEL